MAAILVVDDEPGVREFLRESLLEGGHEVFEAIDADDALAKLEQRPYDAMLLDLRMPGPRNGLDVLERARARWPATSVVVLTAHGGVPEAVTALKLGAFDFLLKPLAGPGQLRELMERAVNWAGAPRAGSPADPPPPSGAFGRLLWELRRRRVYRVAVGYAAAAFVTLQGAQLLLPALPLPAWAYTALVAAAVVGFPFAVVLGWLYDIEETGVRRTPSRPHRAGSPS